MNNMSRGKLQTKRKLIYILLISALASTQKSSDSRILNSVKEFQILTPTRVKAFP